MIRYIYFFVLSIWNYSTYGQITSHDSLVCEIFLNKIKQTNYQQSDTAIKICKSLINFAIYKKAYIYIAESYNHLGYIYSSRGDYKKAKLYLDASEKLLNLLNDRRSLETVFINKGNLFLYQEKNDSAILYFEKALRIANEYQDSITIAKLNSNLSKCYYNINDYQNAVRFAKTALNYFLILKDSTSIANTYNNLGAYYEKLDKNDEAFKAYRIADGIYARKNIIIKRLSTWNNLGNLYNKLGKYDSALYYMNLSLKEKLKFNNKKSLCISYGNLSEIYRNINQLDKAELYAKKMLELASSIDDKTQMMYAYQYLVETMQKKKNYTQAYQYFKSYFQIYDSLNNASYKERLNKMISELELAQKDARIQWLTKNEKIKEAELKKKEAEIKNKQLLIYIYILIIFILIIVIVFIYFLIHSKILRKQTLLENQMLTYRIEALSYQINPHFIFNILNSIQYNLNQQDVATTSKYITQFSRLLRKILENSQQAMISIDAELEVAKIYLELEQLRLKDKFTFSIIYRHDLNLSDYYVPPMLLQPYLENAIWHGIMDNINNTKPGLIEIYLTEYQNYLLCEIVDNGIGIKNSKQQTNHVSLGLSLNERRIETFNKLYNTNIEINITDISEQQEGLSGTSVAIKIRKFKQSKM